MGGSIASARGAKWGDRRIRSLAYRKNFQVAQRSLEVFDLVKWVGEE